MQQLTQQKTQQLQQQQQAAAPQQPLPVQPAPIVAQPQQIPPAQQQNQPPMALALVGIYGQVEGVLTPPTRGHQEALDFVSEKMDLSYAGDKPGANSLLHHLQDKARQVNLYEVFEVTTAQGQVLNLFDHYLSISLQEVRAAAITRWSTNTWNRQGSYMRLSTAASAVLKWQFTMARPAEPVTRLLREWRNRPVGGRVGPEKLFD
jgi:hypothetical protein